MNRVMQFLGFAALLLCGTAQAHADGYSVVAWGRNNSGECDVPAPNTDFVAIDGGVGHSLGVKTDGSIVAWGYNHYGQCDVPAPNTGFVAAAGGLGHSLGLRADGSIVAWGLNEDGAGHYVGQCDVPLPNSDFVAVAAGWNNSLGLKSDGTIVAWGSDGEGQCDVPSPNADFVAVAAGRLHSLAVRTFPVGACCRDDGTCSVTTQDGCPAPGIWQGAGTACEPNPCLMGACCLQLYCIILPEDECDAYGGSYLGNGTLCTPDTCVVFATVDGNPATAGPRFLSAGPSPSTGEVVIRYDLPAPGPVVLEIFDQSGALVRRLSQESQPSGSHEIRWDGRDSGGRAVTSGVYLTRIEAAGRVTTGRVVLTK